MFLLVLEATRVVIVTNGYITPSSPPERKSIRICLIMFIDYYISYLFSLIITSATEDKIGTKNFNFQLIFFFSVRFHSRESENDYIHKCQL